MNQFNTFSPLNTVFNDFTSVFITFLPRIFWALIILVLGILAGRLAKAVVKSALHALDLNALIKKAGYAKIADQAELRPKIEEIVGEIVNWLVIFLFAISFFNLLGLTSVADFLTRIVGYTPNLLAATIIFLLAVLLAGMAEGLVKNAVSNIDVITGRLMGKVASYTVMVVGTLIALSELGIAELFINILFVGFVGGMSLALGLAVGLGAKDLVAEILANWHKNYQKQQKTSPKSK